MAVVRGDVEHASAPVMVRMHPHCLVGDIFGATWCECHSVIRQCLRIISQEDLGVIVYLHHTARSFSIDKIADQPTLSFHRDLSDPSQLEYQRSVQRNVGIGAQILRDLNLTRIRILTNHPRRVAALEGYGIQIVEQIPIPPVKTRASDSFAAESHGDD